MKKLLLSMVPDVMMASGGFAVSFGAWLIYAPAGYLVGGVLLIAAGVAAAKVTP